MKKWDWKEDYLIGDIVIVKEGIMCPDLTDLNIAGWKGEIKDISQDNNYNVLICVEWDKDTIQKMPKRFVDQGNEEGLDNNLMYLYPEDIILYK